MLKLIFAAGAILSTAAAAQPPDTPRPPRDRVEATSRQVERAADAMMNVDIGPVLDALSPDGRRHGPATLGELATRRDPHARERMHQEVAGTAAAIGVAQRDAAIIAPIVRRALADAVRQIDAARRQAAAQAADPDRRP